ncbi:MAG: RagB/SusD family nutrient uptake outer membrane protein [Candidatus Pedobacter colombiensis]|uniref:RagB/SusD family nutrient uptake outer membrane protein n=1 Tax=Candidatus Pedobacter colombiensis TaxID=3121371 RepID=A0AAJ6B7X5_9SPHI|nr:RagB/SusD family nutrient uptake outer membrane protein [Pedobacter sp.]WEK19936.1 MAG: RagB/SusD family nutrient uptake outer membrane protein [Pedobacter sp.]
MKTNIYQTLIIACSLILFTSCGKFLEVEPRGRVLLKTFTDFDLLLNSQSLTSSAEQLLNVMTDDADDAAVNPTKIDTKTLSYLWANQLNPTINERPLVWGFHYANIYAYNAVINQVENATTGSTQDKNRLKAEALVGRAFEYLYLVNLYGKPYNQATASTDLAVPFITSTDIMEQTPERATVGFIYGKIIEDLNAALPNLNKNNNTNKFRAAANAAYSVLARTYYYMNNYTEAAKFANKALEESGTMLLDLNAFASKTAIPAMTINKQEIYARYGTNSTLTVPVALDFLKSFNKADLRLKLFYTNLGDFSFLVRSKTVFSPAGGVVSFGTSVSEMKLIIAEAAARANNLQLALDQMNDIRKFRTATASYQAFSSTDQETVLQRVLLERRFELAFKGIRWMDMRKLDAENRMPVVIRLSTTGEVITILEKHSPKYTLKIPASVIHFNPDMPQN